MLGKFTYLGYTLIFTWPLIAFLWWRHADRLRPALRLIGLVTGLATVYGFFVWPYGLSWGCWAYSEDHILGIRILGTVFEDLVWWACIAFLFASFVVVVAGLEDSGAPIIRSLLRGVKDGELVM